MLKTIYPNFLLVIYYFSAIPLFAHQDSVPVQKKFHNEVSFTMLGQNFIYSVNYTSVLKEYKKSKLFQQFSFTYMGDLTNGLSYSLYQEFGTRNHHLVLGAGYLYLQEHWINRNTTQHFFSPVATVGYTFSKPHRRLKLGLHLHYFFDNINTSVEGFLWGGLTIGYKFNSPELFKSLKVKIPEQEHKFKFEAGYEGEMRTGKLAINGIGENSAIAVSNSVYIKYKLNHSFLKTIVGADYLSANKLKNDEYTTTFFNKAPFFMHYGMGWGFMAAVAHQWKIYPEIQIGMYTKVPDLNFVVENPTFESFTNFDQPSPAVALVHENSPWYFKAGINAEKAISQKLSLSLGLNYNYSLISNRIYNHEGYPFKKLTYKSVGLNVGLNFNL